MFGNVTKVESDTATNLVAVIFQKCLWRTARRIGKISESRIIPFVSGEARFSFFEGSVKIPLMDISAYSEADYLVVYDRLESGIEFIGYYYRTEVFNRGKPKDAIKGIPTSSVEKGAIVTTVSPRTNWESFGETNVVVQTPLSL